MWKGTSGRELGSKGAGSLRGAGEEGGGGIATLQIFRNRKKHTEAGTTEEGGRDRENKVWEAGDSDPPVPHPYYAVHVTWF